jgi:hypothetical protein
LGVHCHGCPEPGARAAVVWRTCALAIDGISALSAIVDTMRLWIVFRILRSS